MLRLACAATAAILALSATGASAQDQTLTLDGEVPLDGPDHFLVPFTVPAGIAEIEIRHDDLSQENILDWGLNDPSGFRGWGGGNTEAAIVGIDAASRSYVPGPMAAGEWAVVVGKAKVNEIPANYHIEVVLRDTATLAPMTERTPYQPAAALDPATRWYAGDFHVHSLESGDANASIEAIASLAESRGLDFVELSDHNVNTQLDFIGDAQARHPALLFVPGVEFTTYAGHANGIGATQWVDHKIGMPGVTIEGAVAEFAAQGALFSVNHPALEVGDLCIGCAWNHELPADSYAAVEIATGGWSQGGVLFGRPAIAFWDELCNQGAHIAAIGGSDDHRAGVDLTPLQSPIGDPTTMVYAEGLTVDAIMEAIRRSRTVVKLQGPDDPMIELESSVAPQGDTVRAASVTIRAVITGGAGQVARFVQDGVSLGEVDIDSDPFTQSVDITPPLEGETRVRAEVWVNKSPRTVTSHLWLQTGPGGPTEDSSCGCRTVGGPPSAPARWLLAMLVGWGIATRRRHG